MQKNSILLIISIAVFLLLGFGCKKSGYNNATLLREQYLYNGTNPFDVKLAYNYFGNAFLDSGFTNIPINRKRDYLENNAYADIHTFFISIHKNTYLTKREFQDLLDFIEHGNVALIASYNAAALADSLVNTPVQTFASPIGTTVSNPLLTTYQLIADLDESKRQYTFYSLPYPPALGLFDSGKRAASIYPYQILSTDGAGNAVAARFFIGKGVLILHSNPKVFSNYFLLTNNQNIHYIENFTKAIPWVFENIIWDNAYQNRGKERDDSALGIVFRYPALKYGFLLALALLLIYIFINGRRKQRPIPILSKNENETVNFTQTLSQLYYTENDNNAIAQKMLLYFKDAIAQNYFVPNASLQTLLETVLLNKVMAESADVAFIKDIAVKLSADIKITNDELLLLNKTISKYLNK